MVMRVLVAVIFPQEVKHFALYNLFWECYQGITTQNYFFSQMQPQKNAWELFLTNVL